MSARRLALMYLIAALFWAAVIIVFLSSPCAEPVIKNDTVFFPCKTASSRIIDSILLSNDTLKVPEKWKGK